MSNTNYIVRQGQSIIDCVLSATGDLVNLPDILEANGFDTWEPDLIAGQNLSIPFMSSQAVINQLFYYPPINNNGIDVSSQIDDIITILNSVTITTQKQPVFNAKNNNTYTVRDGESIIDVLLNATGSIINWADLLKVNRFATWEPDFKAGQKIIIPQVQLQTNVLAQLNKYPSNTLSNYFAAISEIDSLISIFEGSYTIAFDMAGIVYRNQSGIVNYLVPTGQYMYSIGCKAVSGTPSIAITLMSGSVILEETPVNTSAFDKIENMDLGGQTIVISITSGVIDFRFDVIPNYL